jgi:hypothetical protein
MQFMPFSMQTIPSLYNKDQLEKCVSHIWESCDSSKGVRPWTIKESTLLRAFTKKQLVETTADRKT